MKTNCCSCIVVIIVILGIFLIISAATDDKKESSQNNTNINQEKSSELQKAEAETKAKAEVDKRNSQAEKYCSERKTNSRKYPILDESIGKNSGFSYDDFESKTGKQLTDDDCKKIIAFMYKRGFENIDEVVGKKYWIGMSGIELYLSAGFADDVNIDNYGSGEREQRIYYKGSYVNGAMYFYVENGKLTSYQDI